MLQQILTSRGSVGTQILALILFVICGYFALLGIESAAGAVTLGRLEREVKLLKDLQQVAQTGYGTEDQQQLLNRVFSDAVRDLEAYEPLDFPASVSEFVRSLPERIDELSPAVFLFYVFSILLPFVAPFWLVKRYMFCIGTPWIALRIVELLQLVFDFSGDETTLMLLLVTWLIMLGCAEAYWWKRRSAQVDSCPTKGMYQTENVNVQS